MAEDLEEDFDETEISEDMDIGSSGGGSSGAGKKKLIMILIPVLLLVGAGAGLYFTGMIDKIMGMFHKDKQAEHAVASEEPKPGQLAPQAVFYDLPEILVNLNSAGRKQNFLKIRVSLELESPLDQPKVDAVMPRIIDNFQVYLRSRSICASCASRTCRARPACCVCAKSC
jgi:flagellar FliL protein